MDGRHDDLLQTNLATEVATGAWSPFGSYTGDPVVKLNDGIFSAAPGEIAVWSAAGAAIEYGLDTSVNTAGYHVTSIQTVGGWFYGPDGLRDAMQYEVYYSVVGSEDWILFDSVNNNPESSRSLDSCYLCSRLAQCGQD